MNVLVTGGCGFIGSNLVRRLVNEGYNVSVVDDLCIGNLATIEDLVESKKVRFINGDITLPKIAKEVTKNIDAVFHLAALIDANESADKPIPYFFTNVLGTVSMLEACVKNGVSRFVFASSAAVYGNSKDLPLKESSPTKPIKPYGETKLLAEEYVKKYGNLSKLKTTTLRLFNVYGPNHSSSYSGVITRFIERVSKGLDPIIYGDGEQTRDFVHIDDIINAFLLTLKRQSGIGETFNIASGNPMSIRQLAELIIDLSSNNEISPIYDEARNGDIRHSYADISKAKLNLGYFPNVMLEQGLRELVSQPLLKL